MNETLRRRVTTAVIIAAIFVLLLAWRVWHE
jgi:hypothetical protein